MNKAEKQESIVIFIYGFDILGFTLPTDTIKVSDKTSIRFVKFSDDLNLNASDGVIIPQGIFEKIKSRKRATFTYTDVNCDKSLMLEKEKEIINLTNNNKWVCFLIQAVIDIVPNELRAKHIYDTDLCKRVLNRFNIKRSKVNSLTLLNSKTNEFENYVKKYGVAHTAFYDLPDTVDNFDLSVLVTSDNYDVGIEIGGRFFFLPFHTIKTDSKALIDISKTVLNAIVDYKLKIEFILPTWIDEFQFETEKTLKVQIDECRNSLKKLQPELEIWKKYKSIISTSGDRLRKVVMNIFEEYFKFKIDSIDEGKEDFKIISENKETLFLVEVKGTNKGIKREHINQVDSHRERNKLPDSIPGILIINNEMGVGGIEKKLNTKVSKEQIFHAKKLNILIIRTIDLLFLIRNLEKDIENRNDKMIELFNSGGGLLKVNNEKIMIIDS